MTKKFAIEYILNPHHNKLVQAHHTDDPVEAEDFLSHLLATGARITTIRHDAKDLAPPQFDRMLKVAADHVIVNLLAGSLGLDSAAIRHRFGFAA